MGNLIIQLIQLIEMYRFIFKDLKNCGIKVMNDYFFFFFKDEFMLFLPRKVRCM